MRTTLSASQYDTDDRAPAFSHDLLQRIEASAGVSGSRFRYYLPMSRIGAPNRFEIEGRLEARIEDQKFSWVGVVGGRYFKAMVIPLLGARLLALPTGGAASYSVFQPGPSTLRKLTDDLILNQTQQPRPWFARCTNGPSFRFAPSGD